MGQTLSISEDSVPPVQLLDEVTFEGVAKYIRSGQCKKIVVMAGAGISTCKCTVLSYLLVSVLFFHIHL